MTDKHDFEAFAQARLEETADAMDGTSRIRLTAMRCQAVAARQTRRGWWLPISLATAMTALVLVWMMPQQSHNAKDVAAMEDLDVLAADVELDLLEDVEFYQWLNEGEHAG